jgi:hypothetical protein
MKKNSILFAFVLFSILLMISTSAADVVTHQETDVLELEPAGDGTYTQIDDDTGEIQIILTEENPNVAGDGVNPEAVTDIGPVFEIQNVLQQRRAATVWIDHASDAVTFTDGDGNEIQSESDGVELQPGDDMTVHMQVDTRGVEEVEIEGITVKATLEPPAETGRESGGVDAPADAPEERPPTETETPVDETPTATPTETDSSDGGTATSTETDSGGTGTDTPSGSTSDESGTRTDADGTVTDERTGEEAGFGTPLWIVSLAFLIALLAAIGAYRYRRQ